MRRTVGKCWRRAKPIAAIRHHFRLVLLEIPGRVQQAAAMGRLNDQRNRKEGDGNGRDLPTGAHALPDPKPDPGLIMDRAATVVDYP
jgi:hypothetical protein